MNHGIINLQWNVRPNVFGGGGWASFSNTYFCESTLGIGPDFSATLTNIGYEVFDKISEIMGGRDIYCMLHVRPRQGSDVPEFEDEIALQDGGYVEPAPWWCSLLVRKYSGDPERYKRGRVYIPYIGKPLGEKAVFLDGELPSQVYADKFAAVLTNGGTTLTPVVSDAATASWQPVTRCDFSPYLAFQRRRGAGKRYYEHL